MSILISIKTRVYGLIYGQKSVIFDIVKLKNKQVIRRKKDRLRELIRWNTKILKPNFTITLKKTKKDLKNEYDL